MTLITVDLDSGTRVIAPAVRIRYLGADSYPHLPPVQCMAYAHALEPDRNSAMDCSELVIVWFQDSAAFPIAPEVAIQLKALPWSKLAQDYCY